MPIAITSPVTGLAQTGFTSPTYTFTADQAADSNAKRWVVTNVGGTQTGVTVSSLSDVFSFTAIRPKNAKVLPPVNPGNGRLPSVPVNLFWFKTEKGATPLVGQPKVKVEVTTSIKLPAGTDTVDAAAIRAAVSAHFGVMQQNAAAIADSCIANNF